MTRMVCLSLQKVSDQKIGMLRLIVGSNEAHLLCCPPIAMFCMGIKKASMYPLIRVISAQIPEDVGRR